ncbi:MAG: LPS assembly lipoprotein LptE, partial [Bryobacteraceae bacterium]
SPTICASPRRTRRRSRVKRWLSLVAVAIATLTGAACGYHTAGHADLVPKTIQTVAVPAFTNLTTRYKLTDRLPEAISHELIAHSRFKVVNDPDEADAVIRGAVISYIAYPVIFSQNQRTGEGSTVVQFSVTMQVSFVARGGKVLYSRPSFQSKEEYEISADPKQFFEESDAALDRLSRDVARDVVSSILQNF